MVESRKFKKVTGFLQNKEKPLKFDQIDTKTGQRTILEVPVYAIVTEKQEVQTLWDQNKYPNHYMVNHVVFAIGHLKPNGQSFAPHCAFYNDCISTSNQEDIFELIGQAIYSIYPLHEQTRKQQLKDYVVFNESGLFKAILMAANMPNAKLFMQNNIDLLRDIKNNNVTLSNFTEDSELKKSIQSNGLSSIMQEILLNQSAIQDLLYFMSFDQFKEYVKDMDIKDQLKELQIHSETLEDNHYEAYKIQKLQLRNLQQQLVNMQEELKQKAVEEANKKIEETQFQLMEERREKIELLKQKQQLEEQIEDNEKVQGDIYRISLSSGIVINGTKYKISELVMQEYREYWRSIENSNLLDYVGQASYKLGATLKEKGCLKGEEEQNPYKKRYRTGHGRKLLKFLMGNLGDASINYVMWVTQYKIFIQHLQESFREQWSNMKLTINNFVELSLLKQFASISKKELNDCEQSYISKHRLVLNTIKNDERSIFQKEHKQQYEESQKLQQSIQKDKKQLNSILYLQAKYGSFATIDPQQRQGFLDLFSEDCMHIETITSFEANCVNPQQQSKQINLMNTKYIKLKKTCSEKIAKFEELKEKLISAMTQITEEDPTASQSIGFQTAKNKTDIEMSEIHSQATMIKKGTRLLAQYCQLCKNSFDSKKQFTNHTCQAITEVRCDICNTQVEQQQYQDHKEYCLYEQTTAKQSSITTDQTIALSSDIPNTKAQSRTDDICSICNEEVKTNIDNTVICACSLQQVPKVDQIVPLRSKRQAKALVQSTPPSASNLTIKSKTRCIQCNEIKKDLASHDKCKCTKCNKPFNKRNNASQCNVCKK